MTKQPLRRPMHCLPSLGFTALLLATGFQGSSLMAQDSETITKVEVKGAQKLTAETILFKAGIKVGDDLRTLDLTAVLERLWNSGSFDDIKFDVQDDKDGKIFVIRVVERPIVKEVDYRGGTEVGLSSLKDKIKEKKLEIRVDSVYDPEATRKLKNLIVEQAGEKGYRNPVIDVNLEPMGPGIARLVFDIKEGGKVKIYDVAFKGNKLLPTSQLKWAMEKTRKHWMFSWLTSHDLLVDKNLEDDLVNLKKAYWRQGYKDAFVGQPTIEVTDFTTARQKVKNEKRIKEGKSPKYDLRAKLVIPILEGERFYEGKLTIEGNEKIFKGQPGLDFLRGRIAEARRDNRSWLAKWLNVKGDLKDLPSNVNRPFDLDGLNKGMEKISEDYRNAAYMGMNFDRKFEVREENGVKKVDTHIKLLEGELYTIRRIKFQGNTTTKDKVLRRSLFIQEGDAFQFEMFKESFTGLGQLGFFDVKTSEPKVEPVPDKPQVDITIVGEEAGVNELLFQGGYSSLFQLSLGIQFSTRNLGGGGETLSFSVNSGKFQKAISIGFSEPKVFDLPYEFGASISNGTTEYDSSRVGVENAYKQFTRSIGVNTGTRLSTFLPGSLLTFNTHIGVGYSFRIIKIEGGRNYFFRDANAQLTSSLSTNISYNTVNHPFKPTNGEKVSLALEYGGWQFGSDKPYYRTTLDMSKFMSYGERNIFGLNTSFGYIGSLSQQALPLYDLYRPGGENTIRGYRWGGVGSVLYDNAGNAVVIGGNKQFLINAEYQFKIADQFRFVAFMDAGNAWAPGEKTFSTALKRSAGLELRFFLPISPAPLRLIWSRKLNPYPWPLDREGQNDFQFSIGTTF